MPIFTAGTRYALLRVPLHDHHAHAMGTGARAGGFQEGCLVWATFTGGEESDLIYEELIEQVCGTHIRLFDTLCDEQRKAINNAVWDPVLVERYDLDRHRSNHPFATWVDILQNSSFSETLITALFRVLAGTACSFQSGVLWALDNCAHRPFGVSLILSEPRFWAEQSKMDKNQLLDKLADIELPVLKVVKRCALAMKEIHDLEFDRETDEKCPMQTPIRLDSLNSVWLVRHMSANMAAGSYLPPPDVDKPDRGVHIHGLPPLMRCICNAAQPDAVMALLDRAPFDIDLQRTVHLYRWKGPHYPVRAVDMVDNLLFTRTWRDREEPTFESVYPAEAWCVRYMSDPLYFSHLAQGATDLLYRSVSVPDLIHLVVTYLLGPALAAELAPALNTSMATRTTMRRRSRRPAVNDAAPAAAAVRPHDSAPAPPSKRQRT